MIKLLDMIGALGVGILFFGLIIGFTQLFRYIINKSGEKARAEGTNDSSTLVKKYPFCRYQ